MTLWQFYSIQNGFAAFNTSSSEDENASAPSEDEFDDMMSQYDF